MNTIPETTTFTIGWFQDVPISLCGNATFTTEGRLRLTPAVARQRGAAWYMERVDISRGFTTDFQFLLSGEDGEADENGIVGADGLAFVVQGAGDTAISTDAGWTLGYHGIMNSLAVEFDTFMNGTAGEYEQADVTAGMQPPGHHISVNTRGAGANSALHEDASIACTTGELVLAEPQGVGRLARITYLPGRPRGGGRLRIFLDDMSTPVLQVPLQDRLQNLLGLEDGTAWVGFTAATGAGWQNHDIRSWTFTAPLPIGG